MKRKLKGITVIEIIVVVAIVGVLAVIIWVSIDNEQNRISEGTVVDRQYTAGYTTVGTKDSPPRYVPPHCTLTISGEKNGEYVEYTFEVPEVEYAQYHVGDHYPKEE
jgi:hypothetical protein